MVNISNSAYAPLTLIERRHCAKPVMLFVLGLGLAAAQFITFKVFNSNLGGDLFAELFQIQWLLCCALSLLMIKIVNEHRMVRGREPWLLSISTKLENFAGTVGASGAVMLLGFASFVAFHSLWHAAQFALIAAYFLAVAEISLNPLRLAQQSKFCFLAMLIAYFLPFHL